MEAINLNLIPSGIMPVCHVSQYDKGRWIRLNLFEGQSRFVINNTMTFELQVRKPDNTIVTTAPTGTSSTSVLDIETTEQMTAVAGDNLCQLQVKDGSDVIGSLNFIMQVEADVLANGDPSQSEIHDLQSMVDACLDAYKFYEGYGTLAAGSTQKIISIGPNYPISAANVTFFHWESKFGVNPINIEVFEHAVDDDAYVDFRFTFEAQDDDITIKVRAYPNS